MRKQRSSVGRKAGNSQRLVPSPSADGEPQTRDAKAFKHPAATVRLPDSRKVLALRDGGIAAFVCAGWNVGRERCSPTPKFHSIAPIEPPHRSTAKRNFFGELLDDESPISLGFISWKMNLTEYKTRSYWQR